MNHVWFGETPFRTVSAFSTAIFLDKWLRGEGGEWEERIERFIDRARSQTDGAPIRGGRVFVQTDDWASGDHAFFSRRGSAIPSRSSWGFDSRMWDYGQLVRGERPKRLTVHTQKLLLRLIHLARKHDWKWELSMDATLKHTAGVGWNVIGHAIRQCNVFLRAVHVGEWDAESMGHRTNPDATAKVRELFDQVAGPIDRLILVETHNEWDAHSKGAWDKDGLSRDGALREVNRQLERMRRIKDGVPEQWPEGAIIVSHGGRDDIEYEGSLADAIAIHPSRPSTRVGDRFHHLRKYGKPIYANEILHYIDPSMWYLVGNGTFRPGSSTKDTRDRMRFVDEMIDDGMWVCEHSLVGMANGVWKDEDVDWEEMPLDDYEIARGAALGGGTKTPPPPPPQAPHIARIINGAYSEILGRPADKGGLESYNAAMESGLTEARMREKLIRSPEYAAKNGGD